MAETSSNGDGSPIPVTDRPQPNGSFSQASEQSQTAQDFITSQLRLEADAREALPYQFDTCTKALGPLRQNIYSCLTCNPPPTDTDAPYTPAGVCYACSISCHGEHDLVELFSKRYFVCDCGTKRLPESSPCTLRPNQETGMKGGVHSDAPATTNQYNQNFKNRFCGCGGVYDPHQEKGTMFQCLGLDGGCGEDWWHPECLIGLGRDWNEDAKTKKSSEAIEETNASADVDGSAFTAANEPAQQVVSDTVAVEEEDEEAPLPPGFPDEEDFDHLICYKCTSISPFIKRYAGMTGFTSVPHFERNPMNGEVKVESEVVSAASDSAAPISPVDSADTVPKKRKAEELEIEDSDDQSIKKPKPAAVDPATSTEAASATCKYASLPQAPIEPITLFLQADFRDDLCRCPSCFPNLSTHPQLLEEEEAYEPPMSEADADAGGNGSAGSRSLLDRGEAALSNMDRVRAIEGVMAYNHVRDKVKAFLRPYAESGEMVGAEDIKAYFEKLRGDEAAIRAAGNNTSTDDGGGESDNRREQGGY